MVIPQLKSMATDTQKTYCSFYYFTKE